MTDTGPALVQEVKKLTNWKNEPKVSDLKENYLEAKSYHDSKVARIEEWLDHLNVTGQAEPKKVPGRSAVQPRLIRKQAEWRYAALSEPFLSSDDIFSVKPRTWEDRKAAQQNEILLNYQFNTQLNKVKFIDEYVRTAVDEGIAIVRVGWEFHEEEEDVEVPDVEYVVDLTQAPLHEHLAQLKANDPVSYATEVEAELQQAHELTMEYGQPIVPNVLGTRIERQVRTLYNRPTLQICDFRNVIIDPTCNGDIDKASFVIYRFESSLSDLKKDGKYKNLDRINLEANSILGEPDHAADDHAKNFNFRDEPRKKFVVYEYWGYWDIDGSGIVRPIVAAWVGNTLIRMEENPYPDKKLPFVAVQYLPVRRDVYGEPDGALLIENQKILGAVTRGMIDLMGRSANGQRGMRKDMLDPTNRRKFEKGLDYEFNQSVDPRQGLVEHTYPEIPMSAQFMVQLQNHEAESLTGVKAFSGGLSGDQLGPTATGVRGVLDAASKREMGILRRLSAGMVAIGRKIIAMNAEFLSEEEVVRVTEEDFVHIRRDDLAGNFDLRLTISTPEEDEVKAQEIAFMMQTIGNDMDHGMRKLMLSEIFRLRKMPEMAKRIEAYDPQPDPLAVEKAQLEIELLRAQVENERAQAMERMAKAQLDEVKSGNVQSDTDLKNLDFVEQEAGVKHARDLQKQGEQARAQGELKAIDYMYKRQLEQDKARAQARNN